MFCGFVTLSETLNVAIQTRDSSDVPINADDFPTFRVYSGSGLILSGQATTFRHTGTITGATNASPIVITSTAHGLSTGNRVNNTGVGGNTNANGAHTITRVSADTFSLDGSTGNAPYTSGGTFRVAGFYNVALVATAGNGFAVGNVYTVQLSWQISSSARADVLTFGVY